MRLYGVGIKAAAALSAEQPLKGLSEVGCSTLAVAGMQSFGEILSLAYPESAYGAAEESERDGLQHGSFAKLPWYRARFAGNHGTAVARLGLQDKKDLKVLSRALIGCGPVRFTRAAAEVELGDMRAPLMLSAVAGVQRQRVVVVGLAGGTTATHNGDGNGWRSAICCDTPFDANSGPGDYCDFTLLGGGLQDGSCRIMVGVARKGTDPTAAHDRDHSHGSRGGAKDADPYMLRCHDGKLWRGSSVGGHCRHHGSGVGGGSTGSVGGGSGVRAKVGDVVGMAVAQGTITLYLNGSCVGAVCGGVHGRLCWVVQLLQPGECVRIERRPMPRQSPQQQRPARPSPTGTPARSAAGKSAAAAAASGSGGARRSTAALRSPATWLGPGTPARRQVH